MSTVGHDSRPQTLPPKQWGVYRLVDALVVARTDAPQAVGDLCGADHALDPDGALPEQWGIYD